MTDGNRSLIVRSLVAVALLVAVFAAMLIDFVLDVDIVFPLGVSCLAVGMVVEFYQMGRRGKLKLSTPYLPAVAGVIAVMFLTWALGNWKRFGVSLWTLPDWSLADLKLAIAFSAREAWCVGAIATAVCAVLVWVIEVVRSRRNPTWEAVRSRLNPMWVVLGFVYASAFGMFLMAHRYSLVARVQQEASNSAPIYADVGLLTVALLIAVCKGTDIGAFLVGKSMGRTKLAPRISPNKSVEGAIGGLAAAIAIALAFWWGGLFFDAPLKAVLYGLLIGIAAQLGDLLESCIKRANGVKDSGRVFFSMGGLLDVLDSVLLAAPVSYILLAVLG